MASKPPSSAAYHIMLALAGGEAHGYGLINTITEISDGAVRLGPGTLYGTISRLLEDGLIEECDERPDPELDDRRRRYYQLSGTGEQVLTAETRRLQRLVQAAAQRGIRTEGFQPQLGGV